MIEDESLLERLDVSVNSEFNISDMLIKPKSSMIGLSRQSEIPWQEVQSDYQPGPFRAVRRYVQSRLEDSWNNV